MASLLRYSSAAIVSFFLISILMTSGCTDHEATNGGLSAFSAKLSAEEAREESRQEYHLAVVTGMDPTSGGRALSWKFLYIQEDGLHGLTAVVDREGLVRSETGDTSERPPVRNWTIDSTSAYTASVNDLLSDGVVSEDTPVKVSYIYLLGADPGNHGCEWFIGLILGSEQPLSVQYNIDGSSGEILGIGT
ncbi:MAG: hypothetical protein ACMUHB_06215 [Thermoplasmatota archaeon]